MLQSLHLFSTNFPITTLSTLHPLVLHSPSSSSSSSSSSCCRFNSCSIPVKTHLGSNSKSWIAQVSESTIEPPPPEEEGPFELPPIFATDDNPSPLQVSTSVLLTGSIAVFLFRSLRRRAKRAKELRYRSTGAKKTLKEEALDSLKSLSPVQEGSPPSPIQALFGGLTAGIIALVLYKFTLTIEAALNRQTISDSFSVRQMTITIRTIINGICYLATFVFGLNAVGLILYSGQLAINSFAEEATDNASSGKDDGLLSSTNSSTNNDIDSEDSKNTDRDQRSDKGQ